MICKGPSGCSSLQSAALGLHAFPCLVPGKTSSTQSPASTSSLQAGTPTEGRPETECQGSKGKSSGGMEKPEAHESMNRGRSDSSVLWSDKDIAEADAFTLGPLPSMPAQPSQRFQHLLLSYSTGPPLHAQTLYPSCNSIQLTGSET